MIPQGHEQPPGNARRLFLFLLIAEGVYLGLFSWRFPLPRLYDTLPPVDYAKLTGYRVPDALALVIAYVLLVGGLAYLVYRSPLPSTRHVAILIGGGSLIFGLTLLWVYPVFAIDMLFYAVHARLWLLYGANPLLVPPSHFPADPWIALKGEWVNVSSAYSPLWELLALVPGLVAGPHNMLGMLMGLKVIALLAYLTDTLLVGLIAAALWPDRWLPRLLFFAWNPLVLLELVGNGHNDGVMLAFILLAVWFLVRGKELAAHVAMGLSVLIKVTPAFLWPLLWLWGVTQRRDWRSRGVYTAQVGLIVLATLAVFAAFLWPEPTKWFAFHESETAGRSPQALGILAASALGIPRAYTRTQRVFQAVFATVYIGIALSLVGQGLRRTVPAPCGPAAWRALAPVWWWTLAALVGIFASNWRPWYGTWFVALAALAPPSAVQRSALALSLTALTGDVFWTNLVWRWYGYLTKLAAHIIGVTWVFGVPALVYTPWGPWRHLNLETNRS